MITPCSTPPAPMVRVSLRNSQTGATALDVPMLLDTGADARLIPRSSLEQIGILPDTNQSYELMGFDGRISVATAAQLDLIFLRRAFKGRFLIIDQDWGLVGRDVLNHVSICFDGPLMSWSESVNLGPRG